MDLFRYLCIIYWNFMKNIVWLISLSLLFLLGIKGVKATSLSEDEEEVVYILHENRPSGQFYSISTQLPDANEIYADAESFPGQLRVVGRSQRLLTFTYTFLSKGITCRMLKYRLEALFQSAKHVYTSYPRPCWSVSSDHYIFGMRRILI